MKKNYTLLGLIILFSGITFAQEAQKNFINYQGVARNSSNELMTGEALTIGIALKFGAANGVAMYEESHEVTTDANGVFSLLIGNGSPANGDYNTLPWGSSGTFITVAMNGNEVGTTEMMAVPYAISSGDADDQSAAEVQYDNSVSGLSATTTQEAIDELMTDGSVDADADPANELQTLSFDSGTSELSLSDGNTISIPTDGTDADPTNEIQTISFDAGTNELSLSDGGVVTIPFGGTDADADPSNEFQTLSFDAGTNELSLSDGNIVTIPSGGTDTDPTNEIQTISFDAGTNELSLSDGGTVTIPTGGTDADADPANEIQDISLDGTELTITDGSTIDLAPIVPPGGTDNQELTFNETTKMLEIEDGNTVDLSSLSSGGTSSLWKENGNNIYYNNGSMGLGLTNPQNAWMHIQTNSTVSKPHLLIEEEGADYARIALKNNQSVAYWHIAGRPSMNTAESKLNFYHHDGTTGIDRMTILGNGNVGVNTGDPKTKLDVNGSFNISGDFVNQSVHKLNRPLLWTPPSSASGNEVVIPGVELNIDVPFGSKVLLSFSALAVIDSDYVTFRIKRGANIIATGTQGYYNIGGRDLWHVDLDGLDADVPSGNHTYTVTVRHSDDADDGSWREIVFYAVVIKE